MPCTDSVGLMVDRSECRHCGAAILRALVADHSGPRTLRRPVHVDHAPIGWVPDELTGERAAWAGGLRTYVKFLGQLIERPSGGPYPRLPGGVYQEHMCALPDDRVAA